MINITAIRNSTPGCHDKLFVNSAGASLVQDDVLASMTEYLKKEQDLGGYAAAAEYSQEISGVYDQVAQLLDCPVANICLATSATDAFDKAINCFSYRAGDVLLTTRNEYISNHLTFLALTKKFGVHIHYLEEFADGRLDVDDCRRQIKQLRPKLVTLTHIPSTSGNIRDARAIGRLCREYDTWFLLDACQSVGQMAVHPIEIGCDFLTATGRKFLRGPRGTGFLYVSDKVLQSDLSSTVLHPHGADLVGTDDFRLAASAKRFEAWEQNFAAMIGLGKALQNINEIGMPGIEAYNKTLLTRFREDLRGVSGLTLMDRGNDLSNIVTFTLDGHTLAEVEQKLTGNRVFYSVARRESAIWDFTNKNIDWAIRLSPHYFNTPDELTEITEILTH